MINLMKDLHVYKVVLLVNFFYLLNLVKKPKANHCLAGLDFLLRDQSYRHTVCIVLEFVLEWHSYLYATDFIELQGALREGYYKIIQ